MTVKRAIVAIFVMALWSGLGSVGLLPDPVSQAEAREGGREPPEQLPRKTAAPKTTTPRTTAPARKATTPAPRRNTAPATAAKPRARKPRRTAQRPRERSIDGLPADASETRFVEDQVIVRYRLSSSQAAMDGLVRRLNLRHVEGRTFQLAGVTVHLYAITDGSPVRQVIAALQGDGTVVTAQPNYIYRLQQSGSSTANPAQYALTRLGIADVHAVTKGAGVSVAVIDSGIDFSHPEFARTSHQTLDVIDNDDKDPDTHGTAIAGILASTETLTGVAPDAPIVGIRAFEPGKDGEAAYSTTWRIAKALDEAGKAGAGVINMSFAGPEDPLVAGSITGAAKRGMIGVAAAGNGGPDAAPLYPAAYGDVIAVTAVDRNDGLYGQANRGDYIELSAPGVDILAPGLNGSYGVSSGTSMAAAHISGMVALILSRRPGLSRAELMTILSGASTDLGTAGRDTDFGQGLPNAASAMKAIDL